MSSIPTRLGEKTVPCELCGAATIMLATKRCDWCWNVERAVQGRKEVAIKVLRAMGYAVNHPGKGGRHA